MPSRLRVTHALLVASLLSLSPLRAVAAYAAQTSPPDAAYRRAVEAWRAEREAKLRADDGWLALVGLYWLEEGVNRVGASTEAEVALPAGSAPGRVGAITFRNGVARFEPAPGVDVHINGRPAAAQVLRPQPGDYDVVTTGSVTLFVIKRGERYGVRVRDANSKERREFAGLRWFPIREQYKVTARFTPHATATSIMIANVLGAVEPWPTPGTVVFTLNGRELTLHPVLDGPDATELFFVFRDGTTGSETYPGGRFLYAAMPKNGEVLLDFNRAESPPCAFTAFATCPLPPKSNTLPVRIEAGELNPHR
jgi:uncharacterized protein (DUF1684 family)